MNFDGFMNKFLAFEEKYEMFKVKINNIYIWHYLRFHVYNDLLENEGYVSFTQKNVINKRNVKSENKLEYIGRKYTLCNQFLAQKRDVLIISHPRKYKDDGKYYKCLYTHLLNESLLQSHYVLDGRTPDGNYEIQRSHNVLYCDMEAFKKVKHIRFQEQYASKTEIETRIMNPVENYFTISIEGDTKRKWFNYINGFINARKYYIQYYSYMLKKIRPKIILVVVAYGFDRMILCEVAHKMHIPVVELQHGTIGPNVIAYNFYNRRQLNSFPDYIFTFGQYEKQQTRFPIPESHIIPTGYPELENNYNKYKKKKGNKKVILFISQTLPKIARFANEVAQSLDADKYEVIFQLHPFEYSCWETTIGRYLSHPNIKVVGSFNHTIYESLAQADWVVGNYSTVLTEAQMFDVKVAILKFDMYQIASFLYQNGYAILVDSPEQLIKEIKKDTFQPNREVSLFEKNSLKNMQRNIDSIITKYHE